LTHKERMIRAARGQWADRLPFAPRLDLWHNANVRRGTLPPQYGPDATTVRIADDLGVEHHRIIPEFLKIRTADDSIDRGLGIFRLPGFAYKAELTNVDRVVRTDNGSTVVEYHTPVGSVSCKMTLTEEMLDSGASISWLDEHVIKRPEDYRVVGHIFQNIELSPDYDNYAAFQREVGDRGLAVAHGLGSASPVQHLMRDLVDGTQFYYELADRPKEVQQLVEDLTPFYDRLVAILAASPAEAVMMGANYDDMITYPPLFKEHILPWLERWADVLHGGGKIFMSHCDGENAGLLDLLAASGIDVAESVCAPPMVQCTLGSMRRAFGGKITIFGGVPSVALLEESMSEEEFEAHMRGLFAEIAPGDRFILGVSDMVPPDARWERLVRIAEMVERQGTLPLAAP
jgi:uroporphyrinogen decarboxylase-like protein